MVMDLTQIIKKKLDEYKLASNTYRILMVDAQGNILPDNALAREVRERMWKLADEIKELEKLL